MLKLLSKIFGRKKSSIQLKEMDSFKEQLSGFKAPGYTAAGLKKGGYPAWAAKSAGYSIKELKDGGYTARALKMAGFPKDEVDTIFKEK